MVPLPQARSNKPRRSGLTMIIDQGMPLAQQADLLELAGDYADLAKIKTGSARLYPERLLVKKLERYRRHRVQPFLGGQFHEYVYATQGERALPAFYEESRRLGFEAIEISDNVVPLTAVQRKKQIRAARGAGLIVYGEVGSKETLSNPGLLEELGPDVNLANVSPEDLIDLETTRVGLGVAGPPKSATMPQRRRAT
jgi:phosphosulfolactate synthase